VRFSGGLRHEDPFSPFLFVIFMEELSKMLFATANEGFFSGFSVGSRHSSVVNTLHLFVDDTLVFSGLKAKSELVHVSNVNNVEGLAGILGCGLWDFFIAFEVVG